MHGKNPHRFQQRNENNNNINYKISSSLSNGEIWMFIRWMREFCQCERRATNKTKQRKTEKNRTFIKYSWKYSSVSVMVLRRRFRLPLPFCHVIQTHCIHEIPFWQSNFFFVPIWFWLFICIWTERKREVLRNRFISPKSMNKRRRKNLLSRTVRLFHLSILMRIFG